MIDKKTIKYFKLRNLIGDK